MSQRTVRLPVNVDIQEGDVAIHLSLHGEMNVVVDAVEVMVEVIGPFPSVGPDHEGEEEALKRATHKPFYWFRYVDDTSACRHRPVNPQGAKTQDVYNMIMIAVRTSNLTLQNVLYKTGLLQVFIRAIQSLYHMQTQILFHNSGK
jgi:hypothetical protein